MAYAQKRVETSFDYIIVGSGSAGSLLANRLSTTPDDTVLVLEAGGSDRNFWLQLPIGYFRTIYDERFSRQFDTEPGEGTGGRNIVWPRGRVIGGSSSINGLIFIRGQREDFEDWEAPNFSGPEDEFIPYDQAPVAKTPLSSLIVYPELAREAGIEGKVYVKAFVNAKGIVISVKILKGIPNTGLDEAAIKAVKKSRWYPARQRDKKVGVWITIPIDFSLTN